MPQVWVSWYKVKDANCNEDDGYLPIILRFKRLFTNDKDAKKSYMAYIWEKT